MPRPTTKTELIIAGNKQFKKMWDIIDSIDEEKQLAQFSFEDRDKNIRDVLIHLYEWHKLLLSWINENRDGNKKDFLPEPYNWKTYPDMNIGFWKKHQKTTHSDAKKILQETHEKVIDIIESFSDEELFTKKYFSWTGTTSLGSYCVSATSSHYNWAIKKIKKHIKSINK